MDSNFLILYFLFKESRFEIISVGITECEKSDRCEFKREKEYSLQIGFRPDRKVENLKTLVWVII